MGASTPDKTGLRALNDGNPGEIATAFRVFGLGNMHKVVVETLAPTAIGTTIDLTYPAAHVQSVNLTNKGTGGAAVVGAYVPVWGGTALDAHANYAGVVAVSETTAQKTRLTFAANIDTAANNGAVTVRYTRDLAPIQAILTWLKSNSYARWRALDAEIDT